MESVNRRKQASTPRILSQFSDRVEAIKNAFDESTKEPHNKREEDDTEG